MSAEEFRSRLHQKSNGEVTEKDISALVKLLIADGACKENGSLISAANFEVKFTDKIESIVEKSGYTPMKKDEFYALDKEAESVVEAMCGTSVVQLTPEYVIHKKIYEKAVQAIYDYITEHGQMTLGDFRNMTDSSRKSSMLILEYTDSLEITKRVENYRVLGSYWQKK